MSKQAMDSCEFESLLARINQQTHLSEKKLHILFTSRGFFSALQASRILYAFGPSADKLKAIQIMEPRLCRMTGSEARDLIGAFNIHTDKVKALNHIKRYLCDAQTRDGSANVLASYIFEDDKYRAASVMSTVNSDVADLTAAGGHQGYAALGGLYTQSRPLDPHLYGGMEKQRLQMPGYGRIALPVEAQPRGIPSMYAGHPSYAYPVGRTYAEDRKLPGRAGVVTQETPIKTYGPSGQMHPGGPRPTGFLATSLYY